METRESVRRNDSTIDLTSAQRDGAAALAGGGASALISGWPSHSRLLRVLGPPRRPRRRWPLRTREAHRARRADRSGRDNDPLDARRSRPDTGAGHQGPGRIRAERGPAIEVGMRARYDRGRSRSSRSPTADMLARVRMRKEPIAVLWRITLFAGLSERELECLQQPFDAAQFDPGAVIVEEGTTGLGFFVIESGRSDRHRRGLAGRRARSGRSLRRDCPDRRHAPHGHGHRHPRHTRHTISRAEFREIVESNPAIAWKLLEEPRP